MLHRDQKIPAKGSCLLLGPRQTGKSTFVRSLLPASSWTVDLLDHGLALRYAKDPTLFRREAEERIRGGARLIFVDEVQKVPALLDAVHALIEAHRVRFILTGSSARKLRRGGANLLAGRAALRRMHPLTMAEQAGHFDLARTLRFGSLPAVVTQPDEQAIELLRSYGDVYLREEIQAESIVRNLGGFARFIDVAAAQCGEILNMSAVGRDAALATRTVQEYFQILEDTLLGFRLEAWRRSVRDRMVAHPRFYLFDTGVTNALNRRLTAELDTRTLGHLFEQWIVLECLRMLDYANSEARVYYWRTSSGAEVDLVVEKHGKLRVAVEIKRKRQISSPDTTGLRSFLATHPGVPAVVVSLVPEAHRIGTIEILPFGSFLARFQEWL